MGFPPKPRTDWLLTVPFPGPGGNTGTTGSEQRPERPKLQQKTAKSQDQTPCHATPCHAEHSVFLPVPSEVSSCYGQAIRAAGSVRVPYASEQTPPEPQGLRHPWGARTKKKGLRTHRGAAR
ncbi:hypothetical protein E4U36_008070 [Claviceps purpurea]|nr:hypothetical protein E4U36_008070 [Claviceps purpurea]